jgi:tetratricopeptide (TPR) repeat protein
MKYGSACLVLAIAGLVACEPLPQPKQVANDVKTVERERKPDKLVARAKMFAQLGDLTRAEQYLTAAIESGGDERAILPLLLRVCVEGRKYRAAINYAENYMGRHPEDFHLRYVTATLYLATGDDRKAKTQLQQVLEKHPEHADAHYSLAVIYRDSENNLPQADFHFREYLRLQPQGAHVEEARGSLLKRVP